MASNKKGLKRLIDATNYSFKGYRAAWRNEAAFRQEGVVLLLAVIFSFWLDIDTITRVLLIFTVALVVVVEIINSAIEAVVDRTGFEYNELSGRAKDLGSAAVLSTILLALSVWCILLWPKLCNFFMGFVF
ncbi:TPA: diacylglycerol kinase [Klebsiella oxytoca]|nr:diacylglycerol kinase [Klebsiella oxytoca]